MVYVGARVWTVIEILATMNLPKSPKDLSNVVLNLSINNEYSFFLILLCNSLTEHDAF